jgi:hypothetical protein
MTQNGRNCSALLLAIVLALSVLEREPPVDGQGRGTLSGIVTHVADGDTLDITRLARGFDRHGDALQSVAGALEAAGWKVQADSGRGCVGLLLWRGRH